MEDQILHVIPGNEDEATEAAQSLEIAKILEKHYPNHPWLISYSGRAIVMRHLAIANSMTFATGREGFGSVLPMHMTTHKNLSQEVVRHAGELLEAFGLPRGPWDGRDPVVPDAIAKQARRGQVIRG